jgi:arylsulfatase A-like enzyme
VAETTSGLRRIAQVAIIAVAAALATTLLHVIVVAVRRHVFGVFSWMWWSRDDLWMIPLGYLLAFIPFAVVVALLRLAWPARTSDAGVAAAFAALSVFSVLILFGRISTWAWLIVAVAAGVRALLSWRAHPDAVRRWSRRLAVALTVLFLVVGGGSAWSQHRQEQRLLAGLPEAPDGTPNVLLIILDTVRASSLSLYGATDSTTPALERRAREGVVFEQAHSTAPWTLPSHASMFTGRYAGQQSGDWRNPLDTAPPTLAEVLRDRGYATGGFTANLIATGFRSGLARGFVRYEDTRRTFEEVLRSSTLAQSRVVAGASRALAEGGSRMAVVKALASFDFRPDGNYHSHDRKSAEVVAEDFLRWQRTLGQRPFFAFLNVFDAHFPYEPPESLLNTFEPKGKRLGRYKGAIRYIDGVIDSMLAELDRRGALENTIVVVTSDHGEHFGEHGLFRHGNSLYRPLLHVPLLILAPGRVVAGTRVSQAVSLRDLPTTVLDLANVPNARGIAGVSLRSVIEGKAAISRSDVIAEVSQGIKDDPKNPTANADLKAALDDTVHVILSSRGKVDAYAYRTDTSESVSRTVDAAAKQAALEWMERVLAKNRLGWKKE